MLLGTLPLAPPPQVHHRPIRHRPGHVVEDCGWAQEPRLCQAGRPDRPDGGLRHIVCACLPACPPHLAVNTAEQKLGMAPTTSQERAPPPQQPPRGAAAGR